MDNAMTEAYQQVFREYLMQAVKAGARLALEGFELRQPPVPSDKNEKDV